MVARSGTHFADVAGSAVVCVKNLDRFTLPTFKTQIFALAFDFVEGASQCIVVCVLKKSIIVLEKYFTTRLVLNI